MLTLTISLPDGVARDALARAAELKMPFERYVEFCLRAEGEQPPEEDDPNSPKGLAKRLFSVALTQRIDGLDYRIEDLYGLSGATDWREIQAGFRSSLGKAFKRLMEQQPDGGTQLEDGLQVKVVACGKTSQEQAIYRTVLAG